MEQENDNLIEEEAIIAIKEEEENNDKPYKLDYTITDPQ